MAILMPFTHDPFFRGLDRLPIDDPGAGLPVLARGDVDIAAEQVMHQLPGAILAPTPKIVLDDLPGREITGPQAPGTPATHNIKMSFRISRLGYFSGRPTRLASGQAPHQYVIICRIEQAKRLLKETEWPIIEIGHLVAFTDQSYFTAVFRKPVTTTLKAYRADT